VTQWSFQRKMISGVIVVCLLAILTSSASLFLSRSLVARNDVTEQTVGRDIEDARALQLTGVETVGDVRTSLLAGGRAFAPAAREGGARVRELALRLKARTRDGEGAALVDSVLAAAAGYEAAFDLALAASDQPGGRAALSLTSAALWRGERLDSALATLVARVESDRISRLAQSRAAAARADTTLIVIIVATVLLLALLCLLLVAGLNRSYRQHTSALTRAEHRETEAKSTLSEVESASRLKDEFLATVSHELRNPLAPILTWTQLLRSGTLDAEKTRRALEVIERNVNSQAQLIDDLVDVSRVVSGKFRLDVRPIDLVPVIRAAADAQVPATEAKQIRLQLVLDDRAGLISGDSERLQQVMWNLISNAVKFTPKGGRVQVVLQRAESHVEITVSDSGVGISPDFLPHVFEPFRQGVGGSSRRHGGLGLGLSIVRHIVELHGGEITASSGGKDQGSHFTVKFPLLATAEAVGAPPRRHPAARDSLSEIRLGRLDGIRVLVVDDEPSASEALQALFASCGAQVKVADSAGDAFSLYESWNPDVMISDIAMPGEDGYSLIRRIRIRPDERGGVMPAVALTAYAQVEDRVTILAAGFQMYLAKPADPNELVAVVASLARRRATEAPPPSAS